MVGVGQREEHVKEEPAGRANYAKTMEIHHCLMRLQAVIEVAGVEAGSRRLRRRRW